MIQINPLQRYIDGGARAAITTPPSASLVFDLPGRAIWVKGVKLKGTDHTYTFSHDNYISLTNTPGSNESEDILIGINTTLLKQAIDTTYGIVSATANGLAPMFSSANKATAAAATTYNFLGIAGTTLKWYSLPWRNVRINAETSDKLGVNDTDPLIISQGTGISVTWDSSGKKIVITNTAPDQNHNTDSSVAQTRTVLNKDYPLILKGSADSTGIIAGVNFNESITYNPSTLRLLINGQKVVTVADVYVGATASAAATSGLVPAATSAQRNYFLRGDGTWATPQDLNTWRPIKVNSSEKLGSGTDTGAVDFVAGTGITLGWDATNKKITITNSAPDQNHNTDRTGIKLGTISGTKKTDSTVILANSTVGLTIAGGTNKFSIGDGTNYIEVPITISHGLSTKNITINGTAYAIYTSASSLPTFVAPGSYAGTGGYILATNSAKNGLEWVAKPTSNVTTTAIVGNSASATSQITSAQTNPYYNLLEGGTVTRSIRFVAGTGITISAATDGLITITNSAPDINHDTHYVTSMYIGESNDTKSNVVATNPYLKLFDNNTRRSTLRFVAGNGITIGSDASGNITITNSKPDVNHDTHYTTTMFAGENNNTKANAVATNPYLKLFDNDTRRSTLRFVAGTGITIASDASGNITVTNSAPDVNHNTDRTGVKLGTVSGTQKTDSTLIIVNSGTGLVLQGGTNLFKIGDGTNYIQVPITPSFTVTDKSANILTSLTTLATIAGTDIKAKITVVDSSPTLTTSLQTIATIAGVEIKAKITNYNTDENVKQTDNNNNQDSPILLKNGTGTGQITSGTIFADGVTVNPSTNSLKVSGSASSILAIRGHRLGYRHLDAGPKSSWSDSRLYIGYNGFSDDDGVTDSIGFYRSTGTGTYTRTLWAEINSNGLYALTRFGVNGQNTSYNFYVNGSSYMNGSLLMNGNISFSNSGTGFRGINYGTMGDNDLWRIGGAATGSNAGYMEIATADDATEPIYVRQYTGVFSSLTRTLTLLDGSGNTIIPGSLYTSTSTIILPTVSVSTLISSYGLRSDYTSAGYPTEEFLKAWCKWAYAQTNAPDHTAHSYISPNSRGYIIADIYASGINSSSGLPEHITGRYYPHGGSEIIFGTSYGTWYYRYGLDTSSTIPWSNISGKATSKSMWGGTYIDASGDFQSFAGNFNMSTGDLLNMTGASWDGFAFNYASGKSGGQSTRFYNGAQTEIVRFLANGNVGIGTASPSYKLHIVGSVYSTLAGQFGNVRVGGYNMNMVEGNANIEFLTGTGYLDWHYGGSTGDYTTRLIESASGSLTLYGNLGIGVNPSYKLDVNGNTRILGNLYLGSSNTDNFIAFYGNTGDAPGSYVTTFIGEHLWGGSESTELLLMKFNDVGNGTSGTTASGAGPDRIRHLAHAHVFQIMTDTSQGAFATMAASTAVETKLDISRNIINTYVSILLQCNNTWLTPARLLIGRPDATAYTDRGCVGITDGNLHLDSYPSHAIHLNYYNHGNIYFNGSTYYITNDGLRYNGSAAHLLINGVTWMSNWTWSGQGGQPSWLWGSNDGTNMYVWNPSNFSVNYANSAGSAGSARFLYNSSYTPTNNTVAGHKAGLVNWMNTVGTGVGAHVIVSASIIAQWTNDSASYYDSSVYAFIKIGGGYSGSTYGLWMVSGYSTNKVGFIGRNGNNWDGPIRWVIDSQGDLSINGSLTCTHFYESSDIRLKHDISMLSKSIRKFRFNDDNRLYYGFIALELEVEHPELVDSSGEYKKVNYDSAICYYIAELENKVLKLEDEINKLKNK